MKQSIEFDERLQVEMYGACTGDGGCGDGRGVSDGNAAASFALSPSSSKALSHADTDLQVLVSTPLDTRLLTTMKYTDTIIISHDETRL